MSATVSFGMFWQVYARQTVNLPDDIDPDDDEDVKSYIRSVWDSVPIPRDGDYILGSDEFDEESILEINKNAF